MNLIDARSLITLLSFVVFIVIVLWAWNGAQGRRFEQASHLPFLDNDLPPSPSTAEAKERA
jgi:cytochrome c oxidase cbb3-type subunit 4